MHNRSLLSAVTLFVVSASAQSISVVNNSNSAITPSGVVGDVYKVTISGATGSALVVSNYTQNGNPGVWNAGTTDELGNWSDTSPPKDTSFIGTWTEQWSVGGINIGPLYSFEIFDKPSSLKVVSTSAASPNACGNSYGGRGSSPYGPAANVQYQIIGSSGSNETVPSTGLGIMLLPYENDTFYLPDGSKQGTNQGNVIADPPYPWTPPATVYAAATGLYYDVPVTECSNLPFPNFHWSTQVVSIKIGNATYPVATINWSASSATAGHGTLTGDNSVSYNQ